MAGTRLWVQSIFVVEFFAGLWVAVYMGLLHNNPEDPLSILLFPPPGRAFLKSLALQQHEQQQQLYHVDGNSITHSEHESFYPPVNQLTLPAAKAAVKTGSASAFWEKVLEKIKSPHDSILINPKVNTDDYDSTLSLLCQDPSLLLQQQQKNHDHVDLYICDFQDSDDNDSSKNHHDQMNSRVVVRNGTMFFYPPHSLSSSLDDSSSQQRIAALNSIYPNHHPQQEPFNQEPQDPAEITAAASSSSCRHDIPIHFKLLLDMTTTNQDWKVWMDALNLALLKRQEEGLLLGHSLLPFITIRRPHLTFSVETVSNLVAAATRRETTTTVSGRIEQNKENGNKDDGKGSESPWNQTTVLSSSIRHEITLDQLVQSISDNRLLSSLDSRHGHDDDDPFIAYFYISNLPEPLVVVDHDNDDNEERIIVTSASRTVAMSNRLIFRILDEAAIVHAQQQHNNNNDNGEGYRLLPIQKEAALALDQVMDFMTRSCLGIGATTTMAADEDLQHHQKQPTPLWETDGSFPQFHQTLLFQRAVQELYEKAVTAVQTQRYLVLTTSNRVPIREHHTDVWKRAVDNIFKAIKLLKEIQPKDTMQKETRTSHESMMMVLDCLQQAIRLMEQMGANPDFIDRIDFPLEQYAAIFAPLALPLAIPLLVGLISEFKRYREKQRKKKSSSVSSSLLLAGTTTTAPSRSNDTSIKQD